MNSVENTKSVLQMGMSTVHSLIVKPEPPGPSSIDNYNVVVHGILASFLDICTRTILVTATIMLLVSGVVMPTKVPQCNDAAVQSLSSWFY